MSDTGSIPGDLQTAIGILIDEGVGDFVYQVRERELEGWEGERVKAWSDACQVLRKYHKMAHEEKPATNSIACDVHGEPFHYSIGDQMTETKEGQPICFNWMAQVGSDHVALFHQDGTVELFPRVGDPIRVEPTAELTAEITEITYLPDALAHQFVLLADYVGRLRNSVIELTGVLPDAKHDPDEDGYDPWVYCWEELDDGAQQKVKRARENARMAIRG